MAENQNTLPANPLVDDAGPWATIDNVVAVVEFLSEAAYNRTGGDPAAEAARHGAYLVSQAVITALEHARAQITLGADEQPSVRRAA